jgi:hypothetical protein
MIRELTSGIVLLVIQDLEKHQEHLKQFHVGTFTQGTAVALDVLVVSGLIHQRFLCCECSALS